MDLSGLITQFKDSNLGSPEIPKNYIFVERPAFEFPLKFHTADAPFLKLPKVFREKFDKDDKLFLEILQLSCSGKGLEELSTKFELLPFHLVNRVDRSQGASPLHYACLNGHKSVVKYLLDSGADVDIWDSSKKVTPLICAAAYGHLEVVNLLLEHGADVDRGLNEDNQSGSALLWAVRGNQSEVVRCLIANNSCQNSTILYSETPVHAAIKAGSVAILELLFGQGEQPKVDFHMGSRRDTPLHLVARGEYPNSLQTCNLLLHKGNVSVNAVNASGKTALHLAAAGKNVEVIQLLLSHWASVDAQDKDGRTPLFHTISDAIESLKTLEMLIFRGKCNVNHQDKFGYTALHLAAYRGAEGAAEILLLGGADFSLKSTGGVTALSMLHRKIPHISKLLHKVFDRAVTISQEGNPNDLQGSPFFSGEMSRQDCKIEVNFKYVLPSMPPSSLASITEDSNKKEKKNRLSRMATILSRQEVDDDEDVKNGKPRKETAKMKCLLDEGLTSLLLHPVVHSFLEMKWQKAKPILLPVVLYKVAFVLLFSVYVEMPFMFHNGTLLNNASLPVVVNDANVTSRGGKPVEMIPPVNIWFPLMYFLLVTMAAFKGIMEFTHFLRAPKTQWRSLEHWISLTVLLILIINMRPSWWGTKYHKTYHRSMAALGILLAWIDIWINMSRFPKLGQSIRVFFQVFKNFATFVLPHFCLLAGFVLSLTLLMPDNGEFRQVPFTVAKMVRIMAGDITISGDGTRTVDGKFKDIVSHFLLVYIYTAFVLMCAIVLMNLLTGLAVNDVQGIYAEASINKLVKQTLLLNTMESNFKERFDRCVCVVIRVV